MSYTRVSNVTSVGGPTLAGLLVVHEGPVFGADAANRTHLTVDCHTQVFTLAALRTPVEKVRDTHYTISLTQPIDYF